MREISVFTFLRNLHHNIPHEYVNNREICYFPSKQEFIPTIKIADMLKDKGVFLNHEESFFQRKFICENDLEWKNRTKQLRKDCNYTCQISGIDIDTAKRWSNEIFGISYDEDWINNWTVIHHKSKDIPYDRPEESNLLVLNRAIHLAYHKRYYIEAFIKRDKPDYKIWFEIGCLIPDRNGQYPWRAVHERLIAA